MLWKSSVHLHGTSRLQVVNYFSIMTVAKHIMTAAKESGLLYHHASSPVIYQPQRIRLLSDVNVFGGLFLSWSTLRTLVTNSDGSFANKSVRMNDSLTGMNRPDSPFLFSLVRLVRIVRSPRFDSQAHPLVAESLTLTRESLFIHWLC